jgi:hypothetical protein
MLSIDRWLVGSLKVSDAWLGGLRERDTGLEALACCVGRPLQPVPLSVSR